MVVGETQAGKSTFITLAHLLNGVSVPDHLKTGNSMLSQTLVPSKYTIPHKGFTYTFPTPKGKSPANHWEWLASVCKVADAATLQSDEPFDIHLLDTPGLNHSTLQAGQDEENIASVLAALEKDCEVNAVLFVVKSDIALTSSFQKMFRYYKQLLAPLADK